MTRDIFNTNSVASIGANVDKGLRDDVILYSNDV